MPSFQKEFGEAISKSMSEGKGPAVKLKYKNWELILAARIPVQKKFSGSIRLISTNSEYKQAVIIEVDYRKTKRITIGSQKERSFIIWEEDFANAGGVIHFEGTSKNGELFVYNAWEQTDHLDTPFTNYWMHGAAMIEEINGNTRRYKCNDGVPDDNFDDIIFEVTINEEPITDKK
jgi:hypothetical protein